MQVTELESKGLKKTYKIAVEAVRINAQMEAELKAAGERIKIPGFRPGFIPMKILQQRYGKSVQPEVLKAVINQATAEVIAESKQKPTLMPQINIEDYKEGGALVFTMSFEAFPPIPKVSFDGITLERKIFDIGEEEIDKAVSRIAEQNPKFTRLEGKKAERGQMVKIDFKGMIDGVAFEGGAANDFRLELDSGQFIEGFEEQLVGAKEGDDRIIKVTFPKDYPAEKLAGKEASFAVKVKEIYAKETPPADDAFAKMLGFADIRAMHEVIRDRMIKEYEHVVRGQLKKQLFDALDEQYDFELPQGMVDMEFNTIWEQLKREKQDEGKDEEALKKEYRSIAERRVKLGLFLADVGSRNDIRIGRDELSRAVMQQAGMYPGQEKKILDFYREHPERMEDLRGPILEEKAVDFILSKVKCNDRKVPLAELAAEDENEETSAKPQKSAKEKSSKATDQPKKPARKKKVAAE